MRDVGGNELAIYNDTTVVFWNVYGLDNVGRINYSDNSWNFYLKDHLGSVRCVIDGNGDIISAEDLDMWGYRMSDRSFQSDTTFYKYTGKERDVTTGYDYFGARYYDSRIGRWGQVEPLLEKYVSWSPYNYGLNNPMRLVDVDGKELILGGDVQKAYEDLLSLLPVEAQDRLTYNESSNEVSFDVSGLNVASDAAYELIDALVTSSNVYLFEVADQTTIVARETTPKYNAGDIITIDLNSGKGMTNQSVTPRNIDGGTGPKSTLPKYGYDGQVSLGKGSWRIPNVKKSDVMLPRSDVVFHELAESYFRTDKKQPYSRKSGLGAHQMAVDMAKKFKKQSIHEPGKTGGYVPN